MSSIIFHFDTPKGLDTPHGKKKLLSRWNLTAKACGITDLICVSKEDIHMNDAEVRFRKFDTLDEAMDEVFEPVVFIEQGGKDLYTFDHPVHATYVFGSDYSSLDKYDNKISIPSILPFHAEVVAGIVLAHRYQQWP